MTKTEKALKAAPRVKIALSPEDAALLLGELNIATKILKQPLLRITYPRIERFKKKLARQLPLAEGDAA